MPSENNTPWTAVEPDIDTITQRYENPIDRSHRRSVRLSCSASL